MVRPKSGAVQKKKNRTMIYTESILTPNLNDAPKRESRLPPEPVVPVLSLSRPTSSLSPRDVPLKAVNDRISDYRKDFQTKLNNFMSTCKADVEQLVIELHEETNTAPATLESLLSLSQDFKQAATSAQEQKKKIDLDELKRPPTKAIQMTPKELAILSNFEKESTGKPSSRVVSQFMDQQLLETRRADFQLYLKQRELRSAEEKRRREQEERLAADAARFAADQSRRQREAELQAEMRRQKQLLQKEREAAVLKAQQEREAKEREEQRKLAQKLRRLEENEREQAMLEEAAREAEARAAAAEQERLLLEQMRAAEEAEERRLRQEMEAKEREEELERLAQLEAAREEQRRAALEAAAKERAEREAAALAAEKLAQEQAALEAQRAADAKLADQKEQERKKYDLAEPKYRRSKPVVETGPKMNFSRPADNLFAIENMKQPTSAGKKPSRKSRVPSNK